ASERAGRTGRRAAERAEGEGEGWREIEWWRVPAHAGRRYARASGDFNPIHQSRATARPFGFRSAILHGFCVEAMVAHALIDRLWAGNVDALRRTAVRFVSPLFIPATVALEVKETADAAGWGGEFRVRESAGTGRILAVGSYLGGRPATQG